MIYLQIYNTSNTTGISSEAGTAVNPSYYRRSCCSIFSVQCIDMYNHCLSFCLLTNVISVRRFAGSDYSFGIFKLFFSYIFFLFFCFVCFVLFCFVCLFLSFFVFCLIYNFLNFVIFYLMYGRVSLVALFVITTNIIYIYTFTYFFHLKLN